MNDNSLAKSVMPSMLLVWLFSFLAGVSTLMPAKPGSEQRNSETARSTAEQSVYSRLWDDPLQATGALAYIGAKDPTLALLPAGESGPSESAAKDILLAMASAAAALSDEGPPQSKDPDLAIFVLLRGMPYPEMAEQRRRQREAAQAAMTSAGYRRLDADRLPYQDVSFSHLWSGKAEAKKYEGNAPCALRVPFEDFKRVTDESLDEATQQEASNQRSARLLRETKYDTVRILYINMNLLDDKPLHRLWFIMEALLPTRDGKKVAMAVTSPPGTGWMDTMLGENEIPAPLDKPAPVAFHIYNTEATGLSKVFDLGSKPVRPTISINFASAAQRRTQVVLHEMVQPDSFTASLICDEIEMRGHKPSGARIQHSSSGAQKDVVQEEQDSSYILIGESETQFAQDLAKQIAQNKKVHVFPYLRGLDGHSPINPTPALAPDYSTTAQRAASAKSTGEALEKVLELPPLPRPDGPAQYDYCARLGEGLLHWQSARRDHGLDPISVIGVIGTDIEDKMALLKVLRPRFPDALFFTNELDAGYLQPENLPYTRNLLVTSHYDLNGSVLRRSDPFVRVDLPMFRASSQSALVDTIWAALDPDVDAPLRPVGMYEIGLRSAHELPFPLAGTDSRTARAGRTSLLSLLTPAAEHHKPAAAAPHPNPPNLWTPDVTSPRSFRLPVSLSAIVLTVLFVLVAVQRFLVHMVRTKGATRAAGHSPHPHSGYRALALALAEGLAWLRLRIVNRLSGKEVRHYKVDMLKADCAVPAAPARAQAQKSGEATLGTIILFSVTIVFAAWMWWWFIGTGGQQVMLSAVIFALAWLLARPKRSHQQIAWCVLAGGASIPIGKILVSFLPVEMGNYEPFSFFDGVCIWPAILLRVIGMVLAFYFFRRAVKDLYGLHDRLTARFFLERDDPLLPPLKLHDAEVAQRLASAHHDWMRPRHFPIRKELIQGTNPDAESLRGLRDNEQREWLEYLKMSDLGNEITFWRGARWVAVAILVTWIAATLFGYPAAQARGILAKLADVLSLGVVLFSLIGLSVFVADQMWQCRKFVEKLAGHSTTAYGLEMEETLLLVARLTGGVGNLLVYPFAISFVVFAAHLPYITSWKGMTGMYVIVGLILGLLILFAWRMQETARDVRGALLGYLQLAIAEATWIKRLVLQRVPMVTQTALSKKARDWWRYTLARLGRHLNPPERPRVLVELWKLERTGGAAAGNLDNALNDSRKMDVSFQDARIARMQQLITIVSTMREGAFGGWHENPIIKGILIPGAGLGSLQLLQRLFMQ